jgi:hypothetical protein
MAAIGTPADPRTRQSGNTITSEWAASAYHDELRKAGIREEHTLAEDLELTDAMLKAA